MKHEELKKEFDNLISDVARGKLGHGSEAMNALWKWFEAKLSQATNERMATAEEFPIEKAMESLEHFVKSDSFLKLKKIK